MHLAVMQKSDELYCKWKDYEVAATSCFRVYCGSQSCYGRILHERATNLITKAMKKFISRNRLLTSGTKIPDVSTLIRQNKTF